MPVFFNEIGFSLIQTKSSHIFGIKTHTIVWTNADLLSDAQAEIVLLWHSRYMNNFVFKMAAILCKHEYVKLVVYKIW